MGVHLHLVELVGKRRAEVEKVVSEVVENVTRQHASEDGRAVSFRWNENLHQTIHLHTHTHNVIKSFFFRL